MENSKDILEKLLKNHDWWYMMSDDPKVYDKGAKQEEAIKLLKDKVGNEYDTLYNKYAPEEFKTMVDYKYNPKNPKSLEEQEDKIDTISMDIPLFIRMLEYAREDAAEDVDLHDVTEKANLLCKERGILSMEDYDEIISSTEDKPLDESKQEQVFKELKPAKHEFVKRYGKDAEKVMRGRAANLSKVDELKSLIGEEIKRTLEENDSNKTYSLYFGDKIIYDNVKNPRLKSILKYLENEGEDLNDFIILQNGTSKTLTPKSADKLGWDLSNIELPDPKTFNSKGLKDKIEKIANS